MTGFSFQFRCRAESSDLSDALLAQCVCTVLQALPGVSPADQASAQSSAPQLQPHAKAQQDTGTAQNKFEASCSANLSMHTLW